MSNERLPQNRTPWLPKIGGGHVEAAKAYQTGTIVRILNSSGADAPQGGVLSIEDFSPAYDLTATGVPQAVFENPQVQGYAVSGDTRKVVVLQKPIADGDPGYGYIAGCCLAKVISPSGSPTDCGWITGSQYLSDAATGFKVLWSSATFIELGVTYVWAFVDFQTGGGSATIDIVQAVANGASGLVSVKKIQMKADPSLSPNFEQVGSAYDVKYFKL